jgi:hypothetical protein
VPTVNIDEKPRQAVPFSVDEPISGLLPREPQSTTKFQGMMDAPMPKLLVERLLRTGGHRPDFTRFWIIKAESDRDIVRCSERENVSRFSPFNGNR